MKNKELLIGIVFGVLGLFAWYFPEISLQSKLTITFLVLFSIVLIYIREKLSYFFRKYWQEIISILLLTISYLIFSNVYKELLIPGMIILFVSMAVSVLVSNKYSQPFVYKKRELITEIPINHDWHLNHWGSNCASLQNGKMIFTGTQAPNNYDGSHVDLIDFLEIGSTYEIECFAKSSDHTIAMFQLWCHDNAGNPNVVSVSTSFKTPSRSGETIKLLFRPTFNRNLRIHLQYAPGDGKIEISDVKIYKLKT